nr:MAG TPA: hypothetical protein [Caudoviricetes sp.]
MINMFNSLKCYQGWVNVQSNTNTCYISVY